MSEAGPAPLLKITGLGKAFPGVVALSDVDFNLRAGEVHALVGENGAGKSTLSKIIAGIASPDGGVMTFNEQAYAPANRTEAEHRGVRIVLQELNLIGTLSVAENIFFDSMPHRWGVINYGAMNLAAREIMAQVGLGAIDPARAVNSLGVGQQQMVEIAAGLSRRCSVLILDEPTASLTDAETELLFAQIRKLKEQGVAIIYISHRLEEIRRIADRITILRDGRVVATGEVSGMGIPEIIRLMVGRDFDQTALRRAKPTGEVVMRVSHLRSGEAVQDVNFELHRGEILGVAGLMGSGRTETVRAIFGADRAEGGEIFLGGTATPVVMRSPREAVRRGIALLTENRKEQGLLLPMPIRTNITLTCLQAVSRLGGWIVRRQEETAAERYIRALSVRCSSAEQLVGQLSGGNQQKVVMAKWLFRDCDILIFDEPTRGIDVGAKFEIYQLLDELTQKGKAVIVVSSDLLELMAICDRIAVMSAGRLAETFGRDEWTQDKIMAASLSGYLKSKAEVN